MKLSEAIRLGSMMHPQAFGTLALYTAVGDRVTATCAMGAAREAAGAKYYGFIVAFPITLEMALPHPCEHSALIIPANPHCSYFTNVGEAVIHLNDDHRWTRERIADWVEQVEALHAADRGMVTEPVVAEPEYASV